MSKIMGQYALAMDDTLKTNLNCAITNIELHIKDIGDSYLLSAFALPQLKLCKESLIQKELEYKDFNLNEIAEIQNKTEYVFTKYHEDLTLEFSGYYSTIYISKYNDNSFFFNKDRTYFNCNTLEELIFYINEL